MDKISIKVVPVLLFLISCGIMNEYDTKINWYMRNCDHPHIHPGDSIVIAEGMLSPYIAECDVDCKKRIGCKEDINSTSCLNELNSCRYYCRETKIYPKLVHREKNVPRFISDDPKYDEVGRYSDGSYYESCDTLNPYKNDHLKKDTYVKSKWQYDRDICMDHAAIKEYPFGKGHLGKRKLIYLNCLRARGYKMVR